MPDGSSRSPVRGFVAGRIAPLWSAHGLHHLDGASCKLLFISFPLHKLGASISLELGSLSRLSYTCSRSYIQPASLQPPHVPPFQNSVLFNLTICTHLHTFQQSMYHFVFSPFFSFQTSVTWPNTLVLFRLWSIGVAFLCFLLNPFCGCCTIAIRGRCSCIYYPLQCTCLYYKSSHCCSLYCVAVLPFASAPNLNPDVYCMFLGKFTRVK